MTIRVKICGITNRDDALAAVAAGADALGFVFHRPSPRYVAPDVVRALYPRVIKSLRVGRDDVPAGLATFPAAAFVLDTYRPGLAGGTGLTFDWRVAADAVARGYYIVLSGGLHAGNVAAAVAAVHPYAVDTASGVEAAPGIKDHAKMRAFVAAAKAAGRQY
jgi:phosphoribosylanthranilate isomerase